MRYNKITKSGNRYAFVVWWVLVGLALIGCPQPMTPEGTFVDNGDIDGDGILNRNDNCVVVRNPDQYDSDIDGIGNSCDNCPQQINLAQEDSDRDGYGDACDACIQDHRYALQSEARFCADDGVGREYRFSIIRSRTTELPQHKDFPLSNHHIRNSGQFAYLGEETLGGTTGAVIAMGGTLVGPRIKNSETFESGNIGMYPATLRSVLRANEQRVLFMHINPNLFIDSVPSIYFLDRRSDTRPSTFLTERIRTDSQIPLVGDTEYLGIHDIKGRQRKLIATGVRDGSTETVRIIALHPRTTWRDPAARPEEPFEILGTYYPESDTEASTLNANGVFALGRSISYLGTVNHSGRTHLLLATATKYLFDKSHGATLRQLRSPGRVKIIEIDISTEQLPYSRTIVINGKSVRDEFGQALERIPEYSSINGRVLAISSLRLPGREGVSQSAEEKGGIYLYQIATNGGSLSTAEIPIRTQSGIPLRNTALYIEHIQSGGRFGTSLHNMGDLDGEGPMATALAIGSPEFTAGTGLPQDQYATLSKDRGIVYLFYLSEIKSDEEGAPYVELLGYETIDHNTENAPNIDRGERFGESITSFNIGDRKYMAVGTRYDKVHFIEHE